MGKYVRPLTIANTAPVPLLCSVTEAEGIFRLSLELQTKTPAILEAFLRELDMAGISYTRQPALYLPRP